jgi:hypothetical protein
LSWRGDFGRTALPSAIVARAFADLSQIRSKSSAFDAGRIIFLGKGEGAFLALLLASDTTRLREAGANATFACAAVLVSPLSLNPADPGSYLAKRQFAREPGAIASYSPLAFASTAPPVLILTKLSEREDQQRGAYAAAALRVAGRTVVEVTYPQLDDRNPRTYFGWHENLATQKLGAFLKTYCPATKS